MYDESCERLANEFLEDTQVGPTPERLASLAQAIQDSIEEWLEENGDRDDDDRDTMPGPPP